MGHAKRMMEEAEERLFWPTDEHICFDHITEPWLRDRVVRSGTDELCAACGAEEYESIELDSLLDLIAATIRCHWGRAIDDLFHDAESPSGYALIESPPTTDDLVRDEMCGDLDDDLIDLAARRLVEEQWYDRGRIWLEGTELLTFSWEAFEEWARTTPLPLPHATAPATWDPNEAADGIAPDRMLARILELIIDFSLVRPVGSHWYRAVHLLPTELVTAGRVGTVPARLATKPNRMSPEGVPMFYGSADPMTAVTEIGSPGVGEVIYTGEWVPTAPLNLLDLTTEVDVPSFYDTEHVRIRQAVLFLRQFAKAISKPVTVATSAVDYRPTQALTAFMRDNIPGLDGVLYFSAHTGAGCCTLFIENDACFDEVPAAPSGPGLRLL